VAKVACSGVNAALTAMQNPQCEQCGCCQSARAGSPQRQPTHKAGSGVKDNDKTDDLFGWNAPKPDA